MITFSPANSKITAFDYTVFFGTIIYFILKVMYSSGELTPDGITYLQQAQDFWHYKANFPLGYPLAIKLLSFFTGSFFVASKLVNILAYIGIVLFSYRKNFFLSQTILVFSFYPFLNVYPISLSEPLYYFFNYLIIYYVYNYTREGFSTKHTIYLSFLFFLLISVRFSGIFVLISVLVYLAFLLFKKFHSVRSFIILSASLSAGALAYLLINYMYCGFALGQRDHLHINPVPIVDFISKISVSTLKDFSFLNVIIHKGILHRISALNIFVGIALVSFCAYIFIQKRKNKDYFNFYLIISLIIVLSGILYSYYTTKIDDTIRIKSNAYLYLILFIALNVSKKNIIYAQTFAALILSINCFSVIKYYGEITNYEVKFSQLIQDCKDRKVDILYKEIQDSNEKNHSAVLRFKAFLIDKEYTIVESDEAQQNGSACQVSTSEIINKK